MKSQRRMFRVAQAVRQQLAKQIYKSTDDRFNLVTITSVQVSPDLRHAKVYWVAHESKEALEQIGEAFVSANGFFRKGLADHLELRFIPTLRFYYDDTLDAAQNVEALLSKAKGLSDEPVSDESVSDE